MPKKILILSLAYYPETVGGAEIAIKEITDRINPADFEFHLICLRFNSHLPKKEKIGNVQIYRIGFSKKNPNESDLKKIPLHLNKYLFQIAAACKALRLHKKNKYNALWAMMAHSTAVPAAIFNIFKPSVPLILTLQEGDPLDYVEKKTKFARPLFLRAFKKAALIQPISNFLSSWAKHINSEAPIEIIPNGADLKKFESKNHEKDSNNSKIKFNKKQNEVYLITTSRLVKKNGVDTIIESLPLLTSDIKLLIVGSGPEENYLKKLAAKIKVSDRCQFLGQIDNNNIHIYLKNSDIFVRPSRSEGMGNSFIEAMAARLPVIATQSGGIADFLFDEKTNPDKKTTGWAVTKENPEQIAKAIKDILSNPSKTEKITSNAYDFIKEKYNWNSVAQKMQKRVFEKITK